MSFILKSNERDRQRRIKASENSTILPSHQPAVQTKNDPPW
jgi:hypothetical protein